MVALLGVCYDGSSSYLRGAAGAPPAAVSAKLVKELAARILVETR